MAGPFDFLFGGSDPGNVFATETPSTAEIIFKLASSLGPWAPFIGGTRTPLGRVLGAGSALAGGASGVLADLLKAQRTDPGSQLLRIAQQVQQMGTAPGLAVPGAGEAAANSAIAQGETPESVGFPQGVPPAVPSPPTFDVKNLPMATQLAAAKFFPSLDPVKQAEMEQVAKRNQLIEKQINAPLAVGADTTLVDPNNPNVVLRPPSLTQNEREKDRLSQLYSDYRKDVQAEMNKKDGPKIIADAANAVLERNPEKYGELPSTALLISEAKDKRTLDRTIAAEDRRNKENLAAEGRRSNERLAAEERASTRHNALVREQMGVAVLPGVFADKTTGEVTQVTKAEFEKNPKNYKRISAGEAMTVDLLKTSFPMMVRMEELVPKVLAKRPGTQLGTLMQNYAAGKLGVDPDLQELSSLGASLSIEQARALSGSSRVLGSIFASVKGEIVPGIKVTADTAIRQLKVGRREMENRINSIIGRPLQKFESFGAPPEAPGTGGAPSQSDIEAAKKRLGLQ